MKPILRNNCVVSDNEDLELLYSFKNFPVYMGCVNDNDKSSDLTLDLNFYISKKTGSVQLNPLVPLEILYKESHGSGSVGKSWQRHHEALADFIHKFSSKNIFEIGGGHGILAKNYLNKQKDAHWTILEANPTPDYVHEQINFQEGIFDEECQVDLTIDTIVHSHLFEHIYNPLPFAKKLYDSLPNNGYTIFSVPFLEQQIKENITYCLGFNIHYFLMKSL